MQREQKNISQLRRNILTYNDIKRKRLLRQSKSQSKQKSNSVTNCIHPGQEINKLKSNIKVIVDSVPQNEQILQDYIKQLKQKLQYVKQKSVQRHNNYGQDPKIIVSNILQRKKYQVKDVEKGQKLNKRYHSANKIQQENHINSIELSFKEKREIKQLQHSQQKKIPKIKYCYRHRSNTQEVLKSTGVSRSAGNSSRKVYTNFDLDEHQNCQQNKLFPNANLFKRNQPLINNRIISHASDCKTKQQKRLKFQKKQQEENEFQTKPDKKNIPIVLNNSKGRIGDISTIEKNKQTIQFLGESCMNIRHNLNHSNENKINKIIDLLKYNQEDIKEIFLKSKKLKITSMKKLKKNFPKGFFQ